MLTPTMNLYHATEVKLRGKEYILPPSISIRLFFLRFFLISKMQEAKKHCVCFQSSGITNCSTDLGLNQACFLLWASGYINSKCKRKIGREYNKNKNPLLPQPIHISKFVPPAALHAKSKKKN